MAILERQRSTVVSLTSFWGQRGKGEETVGGAQFARMRKAEKWRRDRGRRTAETFGGWELPAGVRRLRHKCLWKAEESLGQSQSAYFDASLKTEVHCGYKLWTNLPQAGIALVHLASLVPTAERPGLVIKVAETPAQICHNLFVSLVSDEGVRGLGGGIYWTGADESKKTKCYKKWLSFLKRISAPPLPFKGESPVNFIFELHFQGEGVGSGSDKPGVESWSWHFWIESG